MFAFVHCVDRDPVVPVVGCCDDHRIDVFAVEDLLVIFGKDVFTVDFLCVIEATGIEVACCYYFGARYLAGNFGVAETHDTHPYYCDVHFIVGSELLHIAVGLVEYDRLFGETSADRQEMAAL